MILLKNLPPRYLKITEAILDGAHRPRDVAAVCGIAVITAQKYLAEMREEGYVVHIKRGQYAINADYVLIPFDRMKATYE